MAGSAAASDKARAASDNGATRRAPGATRPRRPPPAPKARALRRAVRIMAASLGP